MRRERPIQDKTRSNGIDGFTDYPTNTLLDWMLQNWSFTLDHQMLFIFNEYVLELNIS